MGAPTSTVEIANIALDHLGQPPIASLSGTTETGALMLRHFDAARQEVLSKHKWKFANGRATITRTGTPAFDYTDKYALPSDFIRFYSIEGRELWRTDDYDIDELELYANASGASALNLRYCKDVLTVTKWSANFRELVALTLAKAVAYAITRSNNDVERITLLLQEKWKQVTDVDLEDTPPKTIRRTGATEIVNQALDYLGIDPIKDIATPTTQLENLLATHYAQVRKEQLRTHIWKFSKTRAQIARAGTPLFDYPDYYTLPADCIRLLSLGGERIVDQEQDYDIDSRNILVDNGGASTLDIRYVADITDVTKWDVGFTKIVALHLAQTVGPALNAPIDKLNYVAQQIIAFKPNALAIDSQEVRPKRIQRSRFLTQRMRGVFNPDPRFYDFT